MCEESRNIATGTLPNQLLTTYPLWCSRHVRPSSLIIVAVQKIPFPACNPDCSRFFTIGDTLRLSSTTRDYWFWLVKKKCWLIDTLWWSIHYCFLPLDFDWLPWPKTLWFPGPPMWPPQKRWPLPSPCDQLPLITAWSSWSCSSENKRRLWQRQVKIKMYLKITWVCLKIVYP